MTGYVGDNVEALTSALVDQDWPSVDDFFIRNTVRPPVLAWSPAGDQLPYPAFSHLKGLWTARRGERPMPLPSAIDPVEMKPALGRILLLDVLEKAADFRYRLYGTVMTGRMRRDLTGTLVSEFEDSYITTFYMAVYRAVCRRPEILYSCHFPSPSSYARQILRLILPFGESGTVSRILVCIESDLRDPSLHPQLKLH